MNRTINLERRTKYSQPHLLAQQLMNQATGSLGNCGKATSVEKLEGSLEHSGDLWHHLKTTVSSERN